MEIMFNFTYWHSNCSINVIVVIVVFCFCYWTENGKIPDSNLASLKQWCHFLKYYNRELWWSWEWKDTWYLGIISLPPLPLYVNNVKKSCPREWIFHLLSFFLATFLFLFFWGGGAPTAYRSSQARDWIRTAATGPCHSYSNAGSELCLQPTSQLMATPDP